MTVRKRGIDASQRADMWRRWKAGESLTAIARALEKQAGSVWGYLAETGGYIPALRRRCCRALRLDEREEISRGISRGESLRCIGARLGRPASTICREIARNGGREAYRAANADALVWERARRPKLCKLANARRLRQIIAFKLGKNWSPQQIASWLKLRFPDDEQMHISHETIYRSLFVQARGVLKKELQSHLRTRRAMRRPKKITTNKPSRQIVDAISIRQRPAEIEDRAVPGHWEGDLLAGAGYTYIATLVERSSRYVLLVKLANKETDTVVNALKKQIQKLPAELRRSLTWDRGKELAAHKEFTVATNVDVYFCDPSSPWQRGSNENTNGLLRQYFPDGTSVATYTQAELNKVARELNERPRQTLGFNTPAEIFQSYVASTL